jgi:hypothetical protein
MWKPAISGAVIDGNVPLPLDYRVGVARERVACREAVKRSQGAGLLAIAGLDASPPSSRGGKIKPPRRLAPQGPIFPKMRGYEQRNLRGKRVSV